MERDDAFQAVRDFSKKVRDEIPEDPLGYVGRSARRKADAREMSGLMLE